MLYLLSALRLGCCLLGDIGKPTTSTATKLGSKAQAGGGEVQEPGERGTKSLGTPQLCWTKP